MMDLGYVVIALFAGLAALLIWAMRGSWNGKRDPYRHTPLPGHRQEGARTGDGGSGGMD